MMLESEIGLLLAAATLLGATVGALMYRAHARHRVAAVEFGALIEGQHHREELARWRDRLAESVNRVFPVDVIDTEPREVRPAATATAGPTAVMVDEREVQSRIDAAVAAQTHLMQASAVLAEQELTHALTARLTAEVTAVVTERLTHAHELEVQELRRQRDAERTAAARLHVIVADTERRLDRALDDLEQARATALAQAAEAAQWVAQGQAGAAAHAEIDRLAAEAASLRERLDASLIELSAAARARDAREAQQAQQATQLVLAAEARQREQLIAAEQRSMLQARVSDLMVATREAQAEQAAARRREEELAEALASSRRLTRAAVLAARQRESALRHELNALRGAAPAVPTTAPA